MPTSLVKESDVDVLVIGAGPAGLMCANGLAKAGIKVRIVDQRYVLFACVTDPGGFHPTIDACRPGDLLAGRADGLQPRTLGMSPAHSWLMNPADHLMVRHRGIAGERVFARIIR